MKVSALLQARLIMLDASDQLVELSGEKLSIVDELRNSAQRIFQACTAPGITADTILVPRPTVPDLLTDLVRTAVMTELTSDAMRETISETIKQTLMDVVDTYPIETRIEEAVERELRSNSIGNLISDEVNDQVREFLNGVELKIDVA